MHKQEKKWQNNSKMGMVVNGYLEKFEFDPFWNLFL